MSSNAIEVHTVERGKLIDVGIAASPSLLPRAGASQAGGATARTGGVMQQPLTSVCGDRVRPISALIDMAPVPDTELEMRLVNTIVRYESAARPWRRLLEIAADYFPDTHADLTSLRARGVKLELHVDADRTAYAAQLVGPDADSVEADRTAHGRASLSRPLATLAVDTQEYEAGEGRRLARDVATGALKLRYARSLCEGFGFESFDVEFARYQAEIARSKAAAGKRTK